MVLGLAKNVCALSYSAFDMAIWFDNSLFLANFSLVSVTPILPYSAFKLMSFLPNSAFTVSVYLNYKLIRLEDGQLHGPSHAF